jgi:hypothetical protein
MPLADDRLQVGSVIFEHVTTTVPPKDKYYVVVGISTNNIALGTVYINSEVNSYALNRPHLEKLHIPLTIADNPFLKWDSFVDCSDIQERQCADVEACINSSGTKYGYIATLPANIMQILINTIDSAPTIALITKKIYQIRK